MIESIGVPDVHDARYLSHAGSFAIRLLLLTVRVVLARAFSKEAAGLACSSEMASDARESCAMIVILIVGG